MRLIYIGAGLIALSLGTIGVFIPGLPTTPFLLLAAAFFLKGDRRLYHWLISHHHFGKILQSVESLNWKMVKRALLTFWLMVLITIVFLLSNIWWEIVLITFGFIKTGLLIFYYYKKKGIVGRND